MSTMHLLTDMAAAVVANNMIITDGHNQGKDTCEISGLILHTHSKQKMVVVAMHNSRYYSLNEVTLKENKPHLSAWSSGGVFSPTGAGNRADMLEYNNTLTFGGGAAAYWTPEDGFVLVNQDLMIKQP